MPSHLNGGSAIWDAFTARTRGSAAPALGRECFDVGEGYVGVHQVSRKADDVILSAAKISQGPRKPSLAQFGP